MNKLPKDFEFEKYGLKARLVNEDDAAFILKLRTDDRLSRHIHSTKDDLEAQKQWIREYKKREEEGREYYCIYHKDDKPIGVSRVSNVYDYFGVGGSWLCSPDNEVELSMTTPFIGNEISFEKIGLDFLIFDVRKANTHVWKFHQSIGAIRMGESDIDYYYYLYKDNYYSKKDKILKYLNLK